MDTLSGPDIPLRPALFVEHKLITGILDGTYPPGSALPGERALAGLLGVTRPTLREGLHRLAGQGWFTISQGKSTKVNNFWEEGGMGLLSVLAKYSRFLPHDFVVHLLQTRATLLPAIAGLAAQNEPEALVNILNRAETIDDDPAVFTSFDWTLQISMARYSKNPVYTLMFNDFSAMYEVFGFQYFQMEAARRSSRRFYLELHEDLRSEGSGVEGIVRAAMERSVDLWKRIERGAG
ncbi:MAG: GntR family transcriptional regulator [Deltaproteobacteria bacterium]|nr:GntR family transcriptional regulator [Deltaproteobacteria bacterium]